MSHRVVFDNAQSDWNEALPLGNGVFGGMAHFCGGQYHLALNHYEVYYTWHHRYSHACRAQEADHTEEEQSSYHGLVNRAKQNVGDYTKEGYLNYRRTIWPEADIPRQAPEISGVSMPPTGETDFAFTPKLETPVDYQLHLDIENAVVKLELKGEGSTLTAETRVLHGVDAMVTQFAQTEPGLLREITLRYPQRRGHEGYSHRFYQADDNTVACEVSFFPTGEDRTKYPPFCFVVAHRLTGSAFHLVLKDDTAVLQLEKAGKEVAIISCVLTELSGQAPLSEASVQLAEKTENELPKYMQAHRAYWQEFFSRSNVRLPDPVLEKLWYLNLYILACCSGWDGKRYEQASGLNGLWDIRQPTIWGSLWYWDVNIQASYWPVYAANHLELAQVFNEGFLSYAKQAEKRAKNFYGMRGRAIDYPHEFYNCMWPWCAQHLWWYYEYSGDIAFLRNKAYPMFLQQIYFIRDVLQYDEERDCWFFFPDVSPEQGPITRNSVITVATVKYLLQVALEANRIIGGGEEDAALIQSLLKKSPTYPTDKLNRYGEVLRDSELSPPGIELRHPSLLMPIYPLHELGPNGSPKEEELAENTLFFASEHTELGVFPFGWIAAAAARMGMGNMALRVLYEQGLDIILRANGMGAEETDRWINHCAVDCANFYYPFMMECVGEVVNCVNEMLLQSHDGIIRVFPAIPNGTVETRPPAGRQKNPAAPWPEPAPVNWTDCSFDKLLAKGGFEVSAKMENGQVRGIAIHSLRGGLLRLQMPQGFDGKPVTGPDGTPCAICLENGILSVDTTAGQTYHLGVCTAESATAKDHTVNVYTTHLGRQNFIGKHRNTDIIKLLDSFLCDYYVGNDRYHPVVAWRFNFGQPLETIDGARGPEDLKFIKVTPERQFSAYYGYGFACTHTLQALDEQPANYLLRDCVEGKAENSFLLELPKGRYDILVVSGGALPAHTCLQMGAVKAELKTTPGEYKAETIPVVQKADGMVKLYLRPGDTGCWRIHLLVVRKLAAYM